MRVVAVYHPHLQHQHEPRAPGQLRRLLPENAPPGGPGVLRAVWGGTRAAGSQGPTLRRRPLNAHGWLELPVHVTVTRTSSVHERICLGLPNLKSLKRVCWANGSESHYTLERALSTLLRGFETWEMGSGFMEITKCSRAPGTPTDATHTCPGPGVCFPMPRRGPSFHGQFSSGTVTQAMRLPAPFRGAWACELVTGSVAQ